MSSGVTVMQMFVPLHAIKSCIFSIKLTETDWWGTERKASICLAETFFLLGYNEAFSGRSTKHHGFFIFLSVRSSERSQEEPTKKVKERLNHDHKV